MFHAHTYTATANVDQLIMPPPLIGGGIKRCFCLTSVCLYGVRLSDVCLYFILSVAYIGPKSRTERPRKTKIGAEVAHVTHDSDTTFKVKRSKVKVTRPLWLDVQVTMDATSFYATTQSKPLPVDHEYSWHKARWAPQT